MTAVYTTEALSTGDGRDGRAVVQDSDLDFTLTAPKEMGGSGEGVNPEQLFAPLSRLWPRTRTSTSPTPPSARA